MLTNKIEDKPYICDVFINFENEIEHVRGADLSQNFFDSLPPDAFQRVYVSRSKTQFRETYKEDRSGGVYTQQVTISMPRTSYDRSQKIKQLIAARFIFLKLSNGRFLVIGRNDHKQNKKLDCRFSSNEILAQFQYTNRSMFPTGYVELEGAGFPYLLPTQTP